MRLITLEHAGYVLGLMVALRPSYIHPDEHFQSLEMLTHMFYSAKGFIPWEFNQDNAARSYVPLLVYYGPLYYICKNIFHVVNPTILLYLVRAQNYLIFLLTVRAAIPYLIPNNSKSQRRAWLLILSSYVTWSFQSHSFSNSIETLILLGVLVTFSIQMRERENASLKITLIQSSLIVLGVFNRMTFPAFIFFPSLLVFWRYYLRKKLQFCTFIVWGAFLTAVFIKIDTEIFQSPHYVFAPLNNLLYNMSVSNLAEHGLHKRYTHLLINLPQLAGPAIIYLFPTSPRQATEYIQCLPWLTTLSALGLLSLFPHQELRFLIPVLPCICMLMSHHSSRMIFRAWVIFNVAMGIMLGLLHQAGIISTITNGQFYKQSDVGVHIWWKTYSPPTWMYMNKDLTATTTNFINDIERVDDIDFSNCNNQVIDLKGADIELANFTIHKYLENPDLNAVSLFFPKSVQSKVSLILDNENLTHSVIFHTFQHLDLDHFDTDDLSTFIPGFYQVNISYNDQEEAKSVM
ncbi:glycosylphosphatidylinositol-alpha 1,2 mannosyltransferase [Maudiozyma humilis]|uniref:Mannosyltransferase n=1 Tax=Maudiozyma humilis TaxID=51915 RepID=A0AAV5S4Y3_MAUHU|nr:glycosylphosphatidylinositol-alpha 1,2 mannosyltransferase [Kazachstania humilis]